MLIPDGTFIAAALVVGAAIGGHCAAFSGREGRREDRAARDRAICKAEELAGQLFEAEAECNTLSTLVISVAGRCDLEIRSRVVTEQELADALLALARLRAAQQEFADADAMGGVDLEPAA